MLRSQEMSEISNQINDHNKLIKYPKMCFIERLENCCLYLLPPPPAKAEAKQFEISLPPDQ